MASFRTACLLLVAQAAWLVSCQFVNPLENGKSVWHVGDIQTIRFRTKITEFTVALWQQLDGAAKLGPSIYQTSFGGVTEFDFLVRLDDLSLDLTDKFFLWLVEGPATQQGNQTAKNMSSAFFRISKDARPVSSSSTSTTTTPAAATGSPTTTLATTTTSPGPAATPGSQTGDETPPVQPPATAPASTQGGVVISTAALAGIGAAAGVVGLAAIIAIVWCCFRRRYKKRESELVAQQQQQQQQNDWGNTYPGRPPSPAGTPSSNQQPYPMYYHGQDAKASLPRYPLEMSSTRTHEPVELSGDVATMPRRSFD